MDSISELLNGLSEDDINRIKGLAGSLLLEKEDDEPHDNGSPVDDATMRRILGLVNTLKSRGNDDERISFISSLKPLLSENRQRKADEAMKMLSLFDILPAILDSGLR